MLQTASGCIMNKTEDQFCVANILPDTASQQTFISDRVINRYTNTDLKICQYLRLHMKIKC